MSVEFTDFAMPPSETLDIYRNWHRRMQYGVTDRAMPPSFVGVRLTVHNRRMAFQPVNFSLSGSAGSPGPTPPTYRMRAYHTTAPMGYVYWLATGTPDYAGDHAPYAAINLARIRVQG